MSILCLTNKWDIAYFQMCAGLKKANVYVKLKEGIIWRLCTESFAENGVRMMQWILYEKSWRCWSSLECKKTCFLTIGTSSFKITNTLISLDASLMYIRNNMRTCFWSLLYLACLYLVKVCEFTFYEEHNRLGNVHLTVQSSPLRICNWRLCYLFSKVTETM